MTLQIQQFSQVAKQFCAWAEAAPQSSAIEVKQALQILPILYQQASQLEIQFQDSYPEPGNIAYESRTIVFKRFGALPFNYYSKCFDPHNVPDELPVVADVADDLADIWSDLKKGLSLFNAGHVLAAGYEWQQSFWQHWGAHATGAINALHCWHAEHTGSAT
jgi:Domain of unknown function (DUF5063)